MQNCKSCKHVSQENPLVSFVVHVWSTTNIINPKKLACKCYGSPQAVHSTIHFVLVFVQDLRNLLEILIADPSIENENSFVAASVKKVENLDALFADKENVLVLELQSVSPHQFFRSISVCDSMSLPVPVHSCRFPCTVALPICNVVPNGEPNGCRRNNKPEITETWKLKINLKLLNSEVY